MGDQPATDPTTPGFVPVCAIGASAGGVTALQTLFRLLPDDLGLAYVVVVHLAPDHPSAMHEILGAVTRMPVFQVTDGPRLRANCVYVIAPDRELVIDGDDVQSRPFTDPRGRRAPIDMFFRSVAAGRGDGIAVVLTGAGSDGALGVRAIKEAGGIVMVQEPAEAGFPSMPQNAIATGIADVVAPLSRLAERIAEAAQSKEAVRSLDGDDAANDIRRIVTFLRTRTGHDFSGYKRSTVLRRISRRMQVCQVRGLSNYANHLRSNPEEAKELLGDLLISVTMFFRDPAAFVALSHQAIRPLFERWSAADEGSELRAWVVGCASGEEAYSLAILLLEEAEHMKMHVPIQIFATDLDEGALATAREGRYPRSIEADVSAERLKRFFVDEGTHYRINQPVRDLVLFATHSVVREPPFMRLDLITCRNVLIYLERSLQQHVSAIFHYGLKPGGYLFLGTAETADTSQSQFATIDRDARIYRALQSGEPTIPSLLSTSIASTNRSPLLGGQAAASRFEADEILGASHASALEASAPPSALIDAEHTVLHLSPTAGRFILLSAGPLAARLSSIVRPELRLDLKLALDRVFESGQPTMTRLIDVELDGTVRRTSLHIAPAPTRGSAALRAVVYFLDNGPGRPADQEQAQSLDEVRHLHSELKVAQEAELAGRVRHQSAMQELRASNEELQSLNEEYRSTAEELETSKEELQSINEELQTVNAELKSKLSIISAAHNDLQNLTASSEIGTLFLDADLRIRMFTPPVAEVVNLTEADVGRPITNFTHRLADDGIERDVRQVLSDLTPCERESPSLDGRWFTVRVRPYRTLDGKVEGAVVTFDDITERKAAEAELSEEFRSTAILQGLSARLVTQENIQTVYEDILSAALEITQAKAGTVQMLDAEAEELVVLATRGFSHRTEQYFHRIDASSNTSCGLALRTGERSYFNFDPASMDASTRMHVEDGVLSAQSSPLLSRSGKPIGMVSTHWGESDHRPSDRELRFLDLLVRQAADLIEQRQADAALRESEERLRALFTAIPALAWLNDAEGRNLFVNPHFVEFFGLTAQQIAGEGWHAIVHPDDADDYIGGYLEKVRGRQPYSGRFRARASNGTWRWHQSRTEPRYSPDGIYEGDAGVSFDIHDQVEAEAALRESEARYHGLFRASPAPFLILKPDAPRFTITEVNDAYLAAAMRTREEVVGRGIFEAFPDNPDNATIEGVNTLRVSLERVLASGQPEALPSLRYDVARPDGTFEERWWNPVNSAVLDENGAVEAIIHNANDVTEAHRAEISLRRSDARFAQFAASSSDALWIRDAATLAMEYTSPAIQATYGIAPDAILGDMQRWVTLIVPEDRDTAIAHIKQAQAGTSVTHEFRIRRPFDGEERWIRNTDFPLRDEGGRVQRIGGIAEDVTEAKRAIERQGVLTAELQHRTRNLIGLVRATADKTLARSADLADFRERFGDRLAALARVQGLLSRLDEWDRVTFDTLIHSELSAINGDAERISLDGPEGVALRSSTVQSFALALHELATNAVKYGAFAQPQGRLEISWQLERAEKDGRPWLKVDWRERGVAMPAVGMAEKGGGSGRELIERALPYQLGARTTYVMEEDGVHCTIALPVSGRQTMKEMADA